MTFSGEDTSTSNIGDFLAIFRTQTINSKTMYFNTKAVIKSTYQRSSKGRQMHCPIKWTH